MSHSPVSVIVVASGSPDDFAEGLASLRPNLGPRDEVVCVVPPDRSDLRRELAGKPWLTVLAGTPADPGAVWSAGLAATRHPIVVLLDGDVISSAQWLDQVVGAFADPAVVAAGPRCHRSYGPQRVDLPDSAMTSAASFKAYARQWRQQHRDALTRVERLGPVCVAVRREALIEVGVELPYERLRELGTLLLVEGALVAHIGTGTCALRSAEAQSRPLVSASMIVKDEEDVLAGCLTALGEFVDEIVVYDTGSTDRTREIAREYGARVVEGYWNDHFAEARNRSIAHCRGEWIFVVDADEIARGDRAAVRGWLAETTASAALILVRSLDGHGHEGKGVMSIRFFRRHGRYQGRLHEQVVDAITGDSLTGPQLSTVELSHTGYTDVRYAVKDKGTRNLRLAELAAEEGESSHGTQVNLARSLLFAGKAEEALAVCQEALADGGGGYRRTLLQVLIHAAGGLRRFDLAYPAIDDLRALDGGDLNADEMEARVRFADGDDARVLEILDRFPETATDRGLHVLSRRQLAGIEIVSLHRLGRHGEAGRLLRECLEHGDLPLGVTEMTRVLAADGQPPTTIATLVPHDSMRGLLLAAAGGSVTLFDELLEVLWSRYPGDPVVLVFAARAGVHLPLIRSLEWAARLRQHGFADSCTLVALAGTPGRPPRDRVLAAAVALEMFGDDRALPLLEDALAEVSEQDAPGLLDEMRRLAPGIAAAVEPASV